MASNLEDELESVHDEETFIGFLTALSTDRADVGYKVK
jgi:hypothetical protein